MLRAGLLIVGCVAVNLAWPATCDLEAVDTSDGASKGVNAELPKVEPVPIEARVVIPGGLGDHRIYPVELGEISIDRPVDIKLTIANQSNTEFYFDKVRVSCTCIVADIPDGKLKPGHELSAHVLLDTRKKTQQSHLLHVPIKVMNSKKATEQIHIIFKGYLQGYLGFGHPLFVAEVDESKDNVEVVIPFDATAPIVGDLVHVVHTPSLGEHRFERVKGSNEKWQLILSVPTREIPDEGFASSLKLEDVQTGRAASCRVLFTKSPPIRISPRTLRLTSVGEGDFEGSAILSLREPRPTREHAGESSKESVDVGTPIVAGTIAGKSVKVSVKSLNDTHFRVAVSLPSSRVKKMEENPELDRWKLSWSVSTKNHGASQFTVPVVYLRDRE